MVIRSNVMVLKSDDILGLAIPDGGASGSPHCT
jgi:hypothetical protein